MKFWVERVSDRCVTNGPPCDDAHFEGSLEVWTTRHDGTQYERIIGLWSMTFMGLNAFIRWTDQMNNQGLGRAVVVYPAGEHIYDWPGLLDELGLGEHHNLLIKDDYIE